MTDEELREKIQEILRDKTLTQYEKADQILTLIKQANYVRLDPDQSLPENPYHPNPLREYDHQITDAGMIGYGEAQQDMLKAGFRKIEQEDL